MHSMKKMPVAFLSLLAAFSVGTAVTYFMVVWALLYFLYRKEIFLKV